MGSSPTQIHLSDSGRVPVHTPPHPLKAPNTHQLYLDPLHRTRGTYADPRSVSKGNQTAGQNYVSRGPTELQGRPVAMQQAFSPLSLAIHLLFRVNSDFINKSLGVMQAVPCLVAQRPTVLLSPQNAGRDGAGIPGRDAVWDQRLQRRALDSITPKPRRERLLTFLRISQ